MDTLLLCFKVTFHIQHTRVVLLQSFLYYFLALFYIHAPEWLQANRVFACYSCIIFVEALCNTPNIGDTTAEK